MPSRSIAALILAGALLALPAAAQSPPAPAPATPPPGSVGSTVDGTIPARAASTTAVGRTKPPGAAADGTRPDLEAKSRQLDRRIRTGICAGC
ncbi:hypothetical protein [Enterovirga aerilata]|uniref:Uncharacterized protein n=1 Tax=Enterovirga aerilata TaxID=2730920 RepID=A0A849IC53_9HYPH|nr:hypothetical protein [Enterovirga sp. DB1703]NNM73620.1 hypothetical protein [Enterovirga sp. DB1703]